MKNLKFKCLVKAINELRTVTQIDMRPEYMTVTVDRPIEIREESADGVITKVFDNLNLDEVELLQSSGLEDVDGNEIFEGDLVIWTTSRIKDTYEVIFKFGKFLVKDMEGKISPLNISNDIRDSKDCKIVGNIYDKRTGLK